ncbi:MAG: 3'(2'),5'-bisphosphate nucleotidase [FCB group bacterium]|jgi:3'(2'), 5'-bisphosphate nucleotidase|nr:3'(2'),5'-bisphosphate nucleotidase [FCB group bacterium]
MHFTGNAEVQFAIDAVRQAAILAREIEREMVDPALTKDDKSPVTVADFAVQALIGCMLSKAFPNAVLVAEEGSAPLRDPSAELMLRRVAGFVGRRLAYATAGTVCSWVDLGDAEPGGRFWTLDPIDGTKGFLRGDQYAVALALVDDGEVQIGVLGCPNLVDASRPVPAGEGSLVVALRGQGSWVTSLESEKPYMPLRVSGIDDPAHARILRSFESGHTNAGLMGDLRGTLGAKADPVLMDSQAKYGVLAAGAGDILFRLLSPKQPDYREKIWDQAAGSIVVEEAGGRITDLRGRPLDFTEGRTLANNRGILATNGRLHDLALEVLSRFGQT